MRIKNTAIYYAHVKDQMSWFANLQIAVRACWANRHRPEAVEQADLAHIQPSMRLRRCEVIRELDCAKADSVVVFRGI